MSQFMCYMLCTQSNKLKLYGLGLEPFRLAIKMSLSGHKRSHAQIIHNFPLSWHHCLTWDIAFLQMDVLRQLLGVYASTYLSSFCLSYMFGRLLNYINICISEAVPSFYR